MTVTITHCPGFLNLRCSEYPGHQDIACSDRVSRILSIRRTEVTGTLESKIPINQNTKDDSHHITGKLELPCCRLQ